MTIDRETLEAALIGYEAERRKIEERIADVQARLGGKPVRLINTKIGKPVRLINTKIGKTDAPKKRQMSAEGRARIVAAAKKRWAAIHKAAKAKAIKRKPAPKKKPVVRKAKEAELVGTQSAA